MSPLKARLPRPSAPASAPVNVALRKELDLYACIRPCKSYKGVRSRYENIDLVIVRENTEDLYAGVEYDLGTPEAQKIIEMAGGKIRSDSAISIKPFSITGVRRIIKMAFDYAIENKRKKITAVCKANIMKYTDGLFYRIAREVAAAYGAKFAPGTPAAEKPDPTLAEYAGKGAGIEYDEWLVDAMCMQLVQKPENYDVLVMPNLYGDILYDLGAGLVGGLGVAPGANIGDGCALFEGHPRLRAQVQGPEQGQPHRPHPLRPSHAPIPQGDGSRRQTRKGRLGSHRRGQRCHLRHETRPQRPPPPVGTSQMADAIIAKINAA